MNETKTSGRAPVMLIGVLLPLLVVTAVSGLFFPQIYDGLVPPHLIPESQGQDAVTLFLAAPLLALSLRRLRVGDGRGAMVAAGTLGYTAYVYIIYAYGAVVNWFYLGYVACLGLSVYGLIAVLVQARPAAAGRMPRRAIAVFFWLVAAILLVVWVGLGLTAVAAAEPSEANLIIVTDLAFVLPALALAGVWLWRKRPWGDLLGGACLVLLVVLMLSIAAGQIMKLMQGFTPAWGLVGLFGGIALGALVLAVPTFSNLVKTS